jgi:hypothetical protein
MIFLSQTGIFQVVFNKFYYVGITYETLLEMLLQAVGLKLHPTKFVNEYKFLILVIVMKTFSNTII